MLVSILYQIQILVQCALQELHLQLAQVHVVVVVLVSTQQKELLHAQCATLVNSVLVKPIYAVYVNQGNSKVLRDSIVVMKLMPDIILLQVLLKKRHVLLDSMVIVRV